MKNFLLIFSLIFLLSACSLAKENNNQNINQSKITDFTSCVAAGNPVMESYPRQCRGDGQTFTEILKGAGDSCASDSDCHLPMEYAIRSNCPYGSFCYQGKCAVGCPVWDDQASEWGSNCQKDDDCDCRAWDREGKYPCACVSGICTAIVAGINSNSTNSSSTEPVNPIACTQEAKLCPDGSAVGRTGPNCEFAPCPSKVPSASTGDPAANCRNNNGNWLAQYQECEEVSSDWCAQAGGVFNSCASACRHDPEAQMCTMNCVPVCQF